MLINAEYEAYVSFEISVDYGGYNYLLIYGKHINGYFCCVPGWKWGCEMAEPGDVTYNAEKLRGAGAGRDVAKALAKAIRERSERGRK